MKEKQLTITSNNISQKQWSNLILELNLIKKAWAKYATLNIKKDKKNITEDLDNNPKLSYI